VGSRYLNKIDIKHLIHQSAALKADSISGGAHVLRSESGQIAQSYSLLIMDWLNVIANKSMVASVSGI
jgi:hypothetical protein